MTRLALVLLVACGSSKPAPKQVVDQPPPPADARAPDAASEMITVVARFTDRVCACADVTCITQVNDDMAKWATDNAERYKDYKPSDEETRAMMALSVRLRECVQRLQQGGAPP